MICFRPHTWWTNPEGGRPLRERPLKNGHKSQPVPLRCGSCIGCRIRYACDWSTRAVNEASLHEENCFVTCTHREEDLPTDGNVAVRPHQLFMKRLRKEIGQEVRFLMCGEYGEQGGRPHYHYLLNGWRPDDLVLADKSPSGQMLYASETLDRIWGYGMTRTGELNAASADYVARYALKKSDLDRRLNWGIAPRDHLNSPIIGTPPAPSKRRIQVPYIDRETGLLCYRDATPEFIRMSRKPGLGHKWLERWHRDAFPSDFLVIDGEKRPVPLAYVHYYARRAEDERLSEAERDFARETVEGYRDRTAERAAAEQQLWNNTAKRLATREEHATLKAARFSRDLKTD